MTKRGVCLNILHKIRDCAERSPQKIAVRCGEDQLTYQEIWEASDRLAQWILEKDAEMSTEDTEASGAMEAAGHEAVEKSPVAVYGHKHPWMLVCFLACVKSGRAYCPIDVSVPDARVELILQALPSALVLTTEPLTADAGVKQVVTREDLGQILASPQGRRSVQEHYWVSGAETYYIIFTSGSTGTPKGVQISADCLNHYLDWSVGLGTSETQKQGKVFLNQAPFSFDLSVMDLYTSLAVGGTLYCLEKTVQSDYALLMSALHTSDAGVWVSTPSFAEVCLSERRFSAEWMPQLEVFLFCGETLGNRTARKLQERFPEARIVNTYGPTESTVAVTEVLVTPELSQQEDPLPVGRAKPGTRLEIYDEDGRILPEGEKGEIVILGDTVSTGYYRNQELTDRAFFRTKDGQRGYHTGDKGYLIDGMLYYCGRIDLQIKLHGYRIELEDIENNIRKLPGIEHVVVLPNSRGGKVSSLSAYVVLQEQPDNEAEKTAQLRKQLQEFLPDYMVPKKFIFLEQMPMTNNGKADRKRLGGTK
jgi:D-alanine--poly(phosphoribitol) ligase subunit 1